jgi:outer membrane protein assembly factor BamE (lipoprotein component of BamABCDE complex)
MVAIVFVFGTCLVLAGCASSETKLNRLKIGMTKAEVIAIMGQPQNTRATANVEYLIYRLRGRDRGTQDFFVRFNQDKVEAYGKPGDFNVPAVQILTK